MATVTETATPQWFRNFCYTLLAALLLSVVATVLAGIYALIRWIVN
jgi:hypothetical protein